VDTGKRCDSVREIDEVPALVALEECPQLGRVPAALGLVTPSRAFGADFVLSLPGYARTDIPSS
jgi:short subunit dehydrogenase-like uncharacterized protein